MRPDQRSVHCPLRGCAPIIGSGAVSYGRTVSYRETMKCPSRGSSDDTANATSAPAMAALLKLVPVSQVTYGSDYPYFGLDQMRDLERLGLDNSDLKAIGSGNAMRLIPRLRA
jgi:predicted TIM-barrel fold metal-dependent hydrolase